MLNRKRQKKKTAEKLPKMGREMSPSDVTSIIKKRPKDDELHRVVRKFYREKVSRVKKIEFNCPYQSEWNFNYILRQTQAKNQPVYNKILYVINNIQFYKLWIQNGKFDC